MTISRRHITTLLLSVLLGTISTLAIAITCGLTIDPPASSRGQMRGRPISDHAFIIAGRPWFALQSHRPGVSLLIWEELTREFFTLPIIPSSTAAPSPLAQPEDPTILINDFIASAEEDEKGPLPRTTPIPHLRSPPDWGQFASHQAPPLLPKYANPPSGEDIGYGWPCIALWYQVLAYGQGNTINEMPTRGAIVIQGAPIVRGPFHCRVIPYLPAYRGLLLNTLLYSALWSALLLGLPKARRALRRHRNQCPICAYSRAGLTPNNPCPECGRSQPSR